MSHPVTLATVLPCCLQDVNVTALSNYVHDHAYQVMGAFAKCLDIRSNGKVKRESKITSGVKTVLAALHMCESVGVYGMGDTSLPDKDIPYQVSEVPRSFRLSDRIGAHPKQIDQCHGGWTRNACLGIG